MCPRFKEEEKGLRERVLVFIAIIVGENSLHLSKVSGIGEGCPSWCLKGEEIALKGEQDKSRKSCRGTGTSKKARKKNFNFVLGGRKVLVKGEKGNYVRYY